LLNVVAAFCIRRRWSVTATESRTTKGMAKLVQICASANDLFGLDDDGVAYQYNFKTDVWMRLAHGRRDHGTAHGEAQPTTDHRIAPDHHAPPLRNRT
jgi:hypothetical protein